MAKPQSVSLLTDLSRACQMLDATGAEGFFLKSEGSLHAALPWLDLLVDADPMRGKLTQSKDLLLGISLFHPCL